jgi:thiol-disulfide isomerase/thioredoxin
MPSPASCRWAPSSDDAIVTGLFPGLPFLKDMRLLSLSLLALAAFFAAPLLHAAPAPVWDLKDLGGKSVKLSDFKGKVVILDFWATWCPPCREEIPNFVALQNQYKGQGLVIVGISLDQGGPGIVSSFVQAQKINYPIVMGDENVSTQYGDIQAIPTTFIIDPQGNIVGKHEGFTEKSVFEDEVKKLLPASTAAN